MTKTVWIINQYASTPALGMGGRHFYLARELAKQGYNVYLIASSSNHLLREQQVFDEPFKIEKIEGFTFVWVRMPLYSSAHSKQRALNWFLFPLRLLSLGRHISDVPDSILCSSPSPVAFLGAERLAKKFKARLLFEVRDIWPLTLTEIGGYSRAHPFIRLLQWIEDRAYTTSDKVISNLQNAVEHMEARGMQREKFVWIPNGISIDEFTQAVPLNSISLCELPRNKFIIGYTGTLGVANALKTFVDAAELLKDVTDIAFVLVGGGKDKNEIVHSVQRKNLKNVYLLGPIPKLEIPAMLEKFDACYIGWLNDPLYKFGIGANKIPEYLYSGKPIIHAYSGACDPVVKAKAGVRVPAENPALLAKAILSVYKMSVEDRKVLGANGRVEATDNYNYEVLANNLAAVVFE